MLGSTEESTSSSLVLTSTGERESTSECALFKEEVEGTVPIADVLCEGSERIIPESCLPPEA